MKSKKPSSFSDFLRDKIREVGIRSAPEDILPRRSIKPMAIFIKPEKPAAPQMHA